MAMPEADPNRCSFSAAVPPLSPHKHDIPQTSISPQNAPHLCFAEIAADPRAGADIPTAPLACALSTALCSGAEFIVFICE